MSALGPEISPRQPTPREYIRYRRQLQNEYLELTDQTWDEVDLLRNTNIKEYMNQQIEMDTFVKAGMAERGWIIPEEG